MGLDPLARENAEAIVKNENARAHAGNRDNGTSKGMSFSFRYLKGTLDGTCSTSKISGGEDVYGHRRLIFLVRGKKVGETIPYPHLLCEEARCLRDFTRFQDNDECFEVRP